MSANPLARQSLPDTGSGRGLGRSPPPEHGSHAHSAAFGARSTYTQASSAAGSSSSSHRPDGGSSSRYGLSTTAQRMSSSDMNRNHSISTTLGLPLSRVAIRSDDDMEEGEILDEEEEVHDNGSASADGSKTRRSNSPRKYSQGPYEHYSPPGVNRSLPGAAGPSGSKQDRELAGASPNEVGVTFGEPACLLLRSLQRSRADSSAAALLANGRLPVARPIIDTRNGQRVLGDKGRSTGQAGKQTTANWSQLKRRSDRRRSAQVHGPHTFAAQGRAVTRCACRTRR